MKRFNQKKIILFTLGLFTPVFLTTSKVNAGSFGAEIFCTMRDGGNDHESSWDAAYTYIKQQKGGIFGALALKTGIPAAPLAGALIGASILSISGKVDIAEWPIGTRTILEIGIGTVIGTSLTKDSLMDLQTLWRPAILITFTLVITGLTIGLWTSRLLNIDVITTILGAAPGGISGMSLVGSEYGVGAAVATLHAVRLITVLLILPLVVKCLNIFGVIKS